MQGPISPKMLKADHIKTRDYESSFQLGQSGMYSHRKHSNIVVQVKRPVPMFENVFLILDIGGQDLLKTMKAASGATALEER